MRDLAHLEQYRFGGDNKDVGAMALNAEVLNNVAGTCEGLFMIEYNSQVALQCQSSELYGWDRVSIVAKPVHINHHGEPVPHPTKRVRYATMNEIVHVRKLFFKSGKRDVNGHWIEKPENVRMMIPFNLDEQKLVYLERSQDEDFMLPLTPKWQKIHDAAADQD